MCTDHQLNRLKEEDLDHKSQNVQCKFSCTRDHIFDQFQRKAIFVLFWFLSRIEMTSTLEK
ncbi:hypothetical protein PALB_2210 [Pseudoalteromonas luteoviolacea B = ATCC 29581]|nr:hypothetical protein PALB_2210 [Pseudoalteromonas luteoviolacea B = ATCC 29581]